MRTSGEDTRKPAEPPLDFLIPTQSRQLPRVTENEEKQQGKTIRLLRGMKMQKHIYK